MHITRDPSSYLPVRGRLLSSTAWPPDRHHTVMLADCCILKRTEGSDLCLGQLVCTHTGNSQNCPFPSEGHSDHDALSTGGGSGLLGRPQTPNRVKMYLATTCVFLPVSFEARVEECLDLSVGDKVSVPAEPDCRLLQVCLLFHSQSVPHEQPSTGSTLEFDATNVLYRQLSQRGQME